MGIIYQNYAHMLLAQSEHLLPLEQWACGGESGKWDTASFTSMPTQQCVQMNIYEQTLHRVSVRQQRLKLQASSVEG